MELLQKLLVHRVRTSIIAVVIVAAGILLQRHFFAAQQLPTYQTAVVQKGSLVQSVSASGTVSAGNSTAITTQATGIITNVFVKNGDQVSAGQAIANMALDQNSQQKLAAANATYLSAVNAEKGAEENKLAADATLWKDRQTVLDDQNTEDLKNQGVNNPSTKQPYTNLEMQVVDSALIQANKQFDTDQQKVYDSDTAITAAKAQVSAASLAVAQISATITAPMAGTISSLTLTPGLAVNGNNSASSTSTSSTTTSSNQPLGTITLPQSQLQATVNLSEIDAVNVKTGQKVTMTLDAFPNKTFTGSVVTINTTGQVSSGVTTYPTTISFDTTEATIYPNMAVNAKIITNVENDVLLVPSAAVQNANGQSIVRILKNGQPQTTQVQTGDSNDTQTIITSGLNEGDEVITGGGITRSAPSGSTSPFGAFGGRGGGFGGGGGAVIRGGAGR